MDQKHKRYPSVPMGAHHNHIAAVAISPHVSTAIKNATKRTHKENIKTEPIKDKQVNFENLTGPPKVMDQMNS